MSGTRTLLDHAAEAGTSTLLFHAVPGLCPGCAATRVEGARFCPHCGATLAATDPPGAPAAPALDRPPTVEIASLTDDDEAGALSLPPPALAMPSRRVALAAGALAGVVALSMIAGVVAMSVASTATSGPRPALVAR